MIETLQGALGFAQVVFRIVDRAAVVAGDQQVAHHLGVILLQHLAQGEEVAQGLGHLLAVDGDHPAVQPGIGVGLAGSRLALGDLVLVVREFQVVATAVDVEGLAQAAGGHHRALDVPARTTLAPGRSPTRLARLGGLPQHEVQRIFLGLARLDAGTDAQVLDAPPRQLAVAGEAIDPVVDVAIARGIGVALVDQGLDHGVHAVDMIGGARLLVGLANVQPRLVLVHRLDHPRHQVGEGLAVGVGAVDDLVVDVRDVAHVGQVIAAMAQPAGDDIEGHHAAAMAQVAVVIDGHAADVHAHLPRHQRREGFLGLGQGVVEVQRHHCPQESRRVTVRLNTGLPGAESLRSTQK